MNGDIVAQLRELCAGSSTAKKIFESFNSQYERNMTATSVSTLANRTGLNEAQIKEACREFEKLRLGRYIPGRWNSPSRFEWAYKIKDLGAAATGGVNALDEAPLSFDREAEPGAESNHRPVESVHNHSTHTGIITHIFKLRPDFEVTFSLPADLTKIEASRLSRFLTSLPFEGEA